MIKTETEKLAPIEQYEKDKKSFETFVKTNNKGKKTFDYAAFKRLVLSELTFDKFFDGNRRIYRGFTRCEIERMAEHPEFYGSRIVDLSNFMYLHSGYYKRLIDYFVNQAILNYTIDTKILKPKFYSVDKKKIRENYLEFAAQAEKFNLRNEIHNILKRLYRDDACFAYVEETSTEIRYFYLDPIYCHIDKLANGNIYQFYIDGNFVSKYGISYFPSELQELINNNTDDLGRVQIPYEKSLCIKYNNDFSFLYPPFFMMIADILLIDEYKDLAKAQSINDAYKILTMKIPTKDGEITLDDSMISTFTEVVLQTVQNNIGVVTTPFEMKTEEFSSSNADDRDTVSDAISWAFKNVGVSEALMSGASSGSELKLSITNDSGDVFRIYRMIEDWIAFQMTFRGYVYPNFKFVYRILDMTIFNEKDYISNELQMAQNGIPNKLRLASANGMSPIVMLGNSTIENDIFADVFNDWQVLKTSYTQSSSNNSTSSSTEITVGRPKVEDGEISERGENTRDNNGNDPDNRI